MRIGGLILGLLMLAASPRQAGAVPAVNIALNGCTGPSDIALQPGDVVSIYASVLGHHEPHMGYQVQLILQTGLGSLPDAWRFDPPGCQGSAQLTMDHLAPPEVAAVCSSFQGTLSSLQLKGYSYDAPTGRATTSIAVAYQNSGLGNTSQVDPTKRYFLGRWRFDHALSASGNWLPGQPCGLLEVPLCIASVSLVNNSASWVDLNQQERAWGYTNQFVTTQGHVRCPGTDGGAGPPPVAAVNGTWGAIKGQYR